MAQAPHNNYQLLKVYAYYRCLLSSVIMAMLYWPFADQVLGSSESQLFAHTTFLYLGLCIITLLFVLRNPQPPSSEQIFSILFIDILAITIMIHSSGGVSSGLGFLLLACVAAGGIFLTKQLSSALAALATILVIAETISNMGHPNASSQQLITAGSLGFMLFFTSLAINYLSERIRSSTAEAENQAAHASHLQRLAQSIVERMKTGVIAINPYGQIELFSQSAKELLRTTSGSLPKSIADIPELEEHLHIWEKTKHKKPATITLANNQDIRISFTKLDAQTSSNILIFVEDNQTIKHEAQQLKLASLGRLTASIAHEIRNPLSAISHAGELLTESPDLHKNDRRFTEIIDNNAKRVNQIIENILQLSRRGSTEQEIISLNNWLSTFVSDCQRINTTEVNITLSGNETNVEARSDSSHLNQVMNNLVNNGLRYSELSEEKELTISFGQDKQARPFIDIIDSGDGICTEDLNNIFEPFFTTEATGSGLGLYLSKQLCEANNATLSYSNPTNGKSCFRITFAHINQLF